MSTLPTQPTQPAVPYSITDFNNSDPRNNLGWIRQGFLLPNIDGKDISSTGNNNDVVQRLTTTAAFKFTDTTLGGNWAINALPGFTEFADITMGGDQTQQTGMSLLRPKSSSRTSRTVTGGFGQGRIYSEVFDDNAQLITMSFGVQTFNSLSSFFGSFYDPSASMLARTGRVEGLFFQAGKLTGTLLAVPFKPLILGSQIVKSALGIPATKFSYFKPTMLVYWNAVNTIMNGITANLGVHERQLSPAQQAAYVDPNGDTSTSNSSTNVSADIKVLAGFLPDIYSPYGGIDVYAVANRAQRLADAHTKLLQAALNQATSNQSLQSQLTNVITGNLARPPTKYLSDALTNYLAGPAGSVPTDPTSQLEVMSADAGNLPPSPTGDAKTNGPASDALSGTGGAGNTGTSTPTPATQGSAGSSSGLINKIVGWFDKYATSLKADLSDGSNWVTFRTDYGGAIGESFSNSMRSSDLEQKINSQSSTARFASYDFAGGNLVGGVVGTAVGAIMGSITDLATGVAAGLQISGLAALAGAAYVDIPKMFDSSNVSLPTQSFTIELRSWSGHKLALLQNLYMPLSMLLAGVMPRSTGAQSYNGPFCCQLFARGRMQIRNGLITDMSITRGTGNIGFTREGLPLGIDVTFTVSDFSSVMHMPIVAATGFIDKATLAVAQGIGTVAGGSKGGQTGEEIAAGLVSASYTDDSLFSDYLAVLAGLGWKDQIYPFRKWSIARQNTLLNYDSFKSPAHAAVYTNGTWAGKLISAFVRGTDRP
jgi:hypothetical protein